MQHRCNMGFLTIPYEDSGAVVECSTGTRQLHTPRPLAQSPEKVGGTVTK